MSRKHVYCSSDGLVMKSLQGAVALNPSLRLHQASKTVYVSPPSLQAKVSVISGGGAGHEPAHASYTGYGMLAASVSGEIFASPSAKQILSTIRLAAYAGEDVHPRRNTITDRSAIHVPHRKDVLAIINNYTGDRLNFGLAIEKARAEGIRVDSVVVADDVSLLHSESSSLVGPRGLAGNILVCKILGALAERGSSLENLKHAGDTIVSHLASIGVGLDHCHIPGNNSYSATIGDDECEVGLGLHNEPGVHRMDIRDSVKLIDELIGKLLRSRGVVDGGRDSFVQEGDITVLFVNNLGGMSQLEMGAIMTDILARLALSDIHPLRIYSSSFMTSLNAPGFSISLLNVSGVYRSSRPSAIYHSVDILGLLDDPTEAHSWVGLRRFWSSDGRKDLRSHHRATEMVLDLMSGGSRTSKTQDDHAETTYWQHADVSPERVKEGIIGACTAVLGEETLLTQYDTIVGDGDCGTTFSRGAKAILSSVETQQLEVSKLSPDQLIHRIGEILEDNMGGTIGALFAIFFTAWSSAIKRMIHPSSTSVSSVRFMDTLSDALTSLSHHTSAKPGDRTIMDALYPLCDTTVPLSDSRNADEVGLESSTECSNGNLVAEACHRAHEGALNTRGMKPKLGRAVYVELKEGLELPPDPGAWGVAVLAKGFWAGFCEQAKES
ncbi:DAK1/DegV-like protein [Lentinula edodes]|uniref:DAK1/DegV-like protein n=1 Tax=Lentinula edodes TaxID=5353 RepID=UPI001E8CF9E7|nr:DAK1/DegV-like protein [Lentinula edodes]KAH7868859.1 DAK1/DegV-like protein [Lentinula edodes]